MRIIKNKIFIGFAISIFVAVFGYIYMKSETRNIRCISNSKMYYHLNSTEIFFYNDKNCFRNLLNKEDSTIFKKFVESGNVNTKAYGIMGLYYLTNINLREDYVLRNLNHPDLVEVMMFDIVDKKSITDILIEIAKDELPDSLKQKLTSLTDTIQILYDIN